MADQDIIVESVATPEVQQKAERMGWIPATRFKGDPARFVDADLYLERGETVLPIVKEQNKRLHAEIEALKANQTRTEAALAAATKAIDEIEERHTVATQKAVEGARTQLKQQLVAASEAGDHEAIAELTDRMVQLKAAEATAPLMLKTPVPPPPFVATPDLQEWNDDNPWFGKDKRKTNLALTIAQELREGGETATGRVFFDKVKDELEVTLGTKVDALPPTSKVEGGRNGSVGESRQTGGRGWNALPADAKAACDADARQFVGATKKYKTAADWRSRYAEIYFERA